MRARVLWLLKGLGWGGAECLVSQMVPKIDRERFDVDVAYLLAHKRDYVSRMQGQGITVRCLEARRSADPRWVVRLRGLLRDGRYDLVHTHSPLPAAVARIVAPQRTRLVHTEHNVWDAYRRPTQLANAVTYARNDVVLAVSEGVAASIRPPRGVAGAVPRPEVLLHGVDPEAAPSAPEDRAVARARLGLDPTVPVVGNVANLSAKKDHATLVAAIDLVRDRFPEVALILVGDGPLLQELRAEVVRRGLQDTVRFLGARDDVIHLLPALDLFVLSSRFEGLPISLLEAMAARVACIATDVGGVREVVRDGLEGRLVSSEDPRALAEAICAGLDDPSLRASFASGGQARVRSRFSIEHAVRRTEALYLEILRAGASSHPGPAASASLDDGQGRPR